MNPLTIAQFRSDLAEFADTAQYPDATVLFWLNLAQFQVANIQRWGSLLPMMQELVTAHYVVIAARDRAAPNGAAPGSPIGLSTSQSAGPLAESYSYSELLNDDAGYWNQTTYGQRYFHLARMTGAGGIQLSHHFDC